MKNPETTRLPADAARGRMLAALLFGLLLLGPGPLRAAPAPPDTVRLKRWLELSKGLIAQGVSSNLGQARTLADSARQLARLRGLPRWEARALLLTATSHQIQGDFPQATADAQRAYTLAQQHGHIAKIEWQALNLLSAVAFSRQRLAEATDYMRQKLAVAEKMGNDEGKLTSSLCDLGNTLSERKQYAEAGRHLRRALALCRQGKKSALTAVYLPIILSNIAYNEMYQGRLPAALDAADQTLQAAFQQTDSMALLNAYSTRAVVRSRAGQHAGAVADAEKALGMAQRLGFADNLASLRADLPGIYEKAGRLQDALAAERASRQLQDSLRSATVEQQVTELNTKFGVQQQKARITQLTQQQRIAALSADHARAQARLWGGLAVALAALLAVGGWLLRQVRRSRAQLLLSDAELRAANQVKDRANATKDQVMRIIGHDLRGPLATFEQFGPELAELADAPDPAEQHRLATALTDRARAVRELVDNLLNWSRAQTGDLAVLPQPVRLAVVAQSLESVFGPLAAAKGVALRVACAPDVPAKLLTDPNLLGAVLRNLLGNAIKFTPTGGEVRLDIAAAGTAPGTPAALITITDTGRGMGPVQLAAALGGQPVDSTQGTNGEPGTGLGLAVVRHFAGLLRAEWRGESEPGRGTRWTLGLGTVG